MTVPPPRRVSLDPEPAYEVRFAPEIEHEILHLYPAEEIVDELVTVLALHFEDIQGARIGKVEGSKDPVLYKYRLHIANGIRFIFASLDDQKLRIVLTYFPRKHGYRRKDLNKAAARLQRYLKSRDS